MFFCGYPLCQTQVLSDFCALFFPGSNFSPAVFGFRSWLRNQWLVVQYSWPSTAPGNWSRFGWPLLQRARNPFGRSRPSCSLWFAPKNCGGLSKGVTFGQLTKGLTWACPDREKDGACCRSQMGLEPVIYSNWSKTLFCKTIYESISGGSPEINHDSTLICRAKVRRGCWAPQKLNIFAIAECLETWQRDGDT